jgi:hypothetical protein
MGIRRGLSECEGWWVTDRTYGLQFKTVYLRVVPPNTLEGIQKYLRCIRARAQNIRRW